MLNVYQGRKSSMSTRVVVGGDEGRKLIFNATGVGNVEVSNDGPGTARIDFQYASVYDNPLETSDTIAPGGSTSQGFAIYMEVYAESTDGMTLNLDVGLR